MRNQPLLSGFGQLYELSGAEISIIFFACGFILFLRGRDPWSLPVQRGALGASRSLGRARKEETTSAARGVG